SWSVGGFVGVQAARLPAIIAITAWIFAALGVIKRRFGRSGDWGLLWESAGCFGNGRHEARIMIFRTGGGRRTTGRHGNRRRRGDRWISAIS
ncbi:MAG TPA: hypothetical protein VFL30_10320, partial [Rhodanobacteraceae bacterium]|nr:hypothetical protein [Rhodanobacteraceae bacterium]